ncbi:ABC transporter permease [Clostridium nigeriense]|uniref:ABC transporter permease n=1 Tax=Clostridium nigeriense TaxID=1805470 RepID=UPI003D332A60
MINYIRSEIYRNLRNKGSYLFILGSMALVVFLNIVLWIFAKNDTSFPYATTKYAFSSLYCSLQLIMIMCVLIVSIIFSQEYKNQTLKNTVSFGISRSSIYFVKFIISIIFSFIAAICVIATFIISAYILLENSGIEYLATLINSIVAGIPLILFSLVVAHSFYFITEKEMNVVACWAGIVIVIPTLLAMIGRKSEISRAIASYMPWNIVGDITFNEVTNTLVLGWITPEAIVKSIVVGVVGCGMFYIIGLEVFKRKEVK